MLLIYFIKICWSLDILLLEYHDWIVNGVSLMYALNHTFLYYSLPAVALQKAFFFFLDNELLF